MAIQSFRKIIFSIILGRVAVVLYRRRCAVCENFKFQIKRYDLHTCIPCSRSISYFFSSFILYLCLLAMIEKKTAFIRQASNQIWTHSKSTTIHQITNRTVVANEINSITSNNEVFFSLF